jgi:hypothetical protein
VLCGESLRSDLAAWLRTGATALVVAMVEANVPCGDDVALDQPLEALAVFARDTDCRRSVSTAAGHLTAVQIQRRYLARAREHLEASWMPAWAKDVCATWDQVLTRIERGPELCQRSLDWAIKLTVFRDRARKRGFEWDLLPVWSQIAAGVQQARRSVSSPAAHSGVVDFRPISPLQGAAESVRPLVRAHGLQLADLSRFFALRQELFEIDVRFGQLGPRSLFEALDARGVLDHRVPGVDRIDEAIEQPPTKGRARLRGETIRHAAGDERYSCTWQYVLDHHTDAYLDLSDPFAERSTWRLKAPPAARTVAPPRATAEDPSRRTRPPAVTPRARQPAPPSPAPAELRPMFSRLFGGLRRPRREDSFTWTFGPPRRR